MTTPGFLFVTCQVGAEAAVKGELARLWPTFRFSYSRPGFLTFKLPPDHALADDFELGSIFARAYGFSLGKVAGGDPSTRARQAWQLAADNAFDQLHVWQRDLEAPGDHGFQPSLTPEALAAEQLMRQHAPESALAPATGVVAARPGQLVLDVVLVEPELWWVGYHRASNFGSRYPGGMLNLALPQTAVSRAYLKMEESLRWSKLPLKRGDRCVEIGCAPGGSCQALLKRGLNVTGIDPALVHPSVLEHPNFVQIRKRGSEVRRGEFRDVPWLMADMNVAPNYTLDTVEAIVTHRQVNVQGLLLTLKLLEWNLAAEVPDYLDRIRSWGFPDVAARQLQHNRQEICVAARRPGKNARSKRRASGGVLHKHARVKGLATRGRLQQ
jgi:23S rRNA (cytidine2498-2'-O)-methyltransferase